MTSGVKKEYVLDDLAQLIRPDELGQIGDALVIAPHPDDESLGCGGTIALLRERGYVVHVLFISDGTMSHPNSPSYPADRLRHLRETEALEALRILNVPPENALFMRLKDRRVPTSVDLTFTDAVQLVQRVITDVRPKTVFVPWRRDPHPDHRASWQILNAALSTLPIRSRVLEYPIWLWELGREADQPTPGEMIVWCVSIDSVLEQRNWAVAAHRSQVTRLIDDDPTAFYLSPELLMHFAEPRELFLEEVSQ